MSKLWRNLHDEVHDALDRLEGAGCEQIAQEARGRIEDADECNLVTVYQELHDFTRPLLGANTEEIK